MKKNVLEYLEDTVRAYPDRCAYRDIAGQYTFAQVSRMSRAIGSFIGSHCAPGKPVAVFMEKSGAMIVSFLGILYGGCCYCPIDVAMPEERIRRVMDSLSPATVITCPDQQELADRLSLSCPVYDFEKLCGTPEDALLLGRIRSRALDTDPLYILYTSGSTGIPKGVVGCHRMIINNMEWLAEAYPYTPEDVLGSQVPLHFVISLHDIFTPLRFGCCTVIVPPELYSYPARLIECLNENRVSSIFWVPSAISVVAQLKGFEKQLPEYLRYIFFIGEVMPLKQLNYWRSRIPGARYVNMYGSTETHVSMYYEMDREYGDEERLPLGRPCRNIDALILDEEDRQVCPGDGRVGELCIRGAALSLGYYGDPEKTGERFPCNPLVSAYPDRIYRTGDMASYDDGGQILYHGRKDFQIKRMGYRIELGEIETASSAVPQIRECACVYHEKKQMILFLYTSEEKLDTKLLSGGLSRRIPRYMMPNRYIYLETMPRNPNGKIDRKLLKEVYG